MEISHKNSLLFLVLVGFSAKLVLFCSTDGFTLAPLAEKNFWLQKPYNVPLDNRYSYEDEVRRLWVYNHDKPFYDDSGTRPTQKFALRVMITHLEYGNLKGIFMYQREHQVSP
ncbi:hypothetical protein CsSME_00035199 [Camellia sinensis var. sinensis]